MTSEVPIERKLSRAEVDMFIDLGYSRFVSEFIKGEWPASIIYSVVADEVFLENRQGPAVEALRRAVKALRKGIVRRLTPEFDALVKYDTGH